MRSDCAGRLDIVRRDDGSSAGQAPRPPRVNIYGVDFDALDEQTVVATIVGAANQERGGWVLTINTDILRQITGDAEIMDMVSCADIVAPDGMPIIWSSKVLGTELPERVTGSSLIWSLSEAAASAGLSVFLLGGNEGAAEGAAEVLTERFPSLKVVGALCPPRNFDLDPVQVAAAVDAVVAARPSICYVGLGFPKQEKMILELRAKLPNTWFLGIGVSLSIASGEFERAPEWMQRTGLEWLYRLVQEPKRLATRYLVYDLPFFVRLAFSNFRRRWQTKS